VALIILDTIFGDEHGLDLVLAFRALRTVAIYTYDGQKRLVTVTDPVGGVTRYTYDPNHRLLTITDPRNITFLVNEYDSAGRVSRQTQADTGVWQFAYTAPAGLITSTTVTDPRGQTTTSRFSAAGFLIAQTDPLGQTTTYERAVGTNQLLSLTDPLGRTTRYTYDASGNVLTITDALNQTRTFTYDPTFNTVTSITDPLGNRTTFAYDPQGNLTSITDPEQNQRPEADRLKTTFTYNALGQPLTTTDPLGNVSTFEYDPAGNLAATLDPLGHRTERTYDAAGRLLTQTDPLGKTTRFSYDPLNRLQSLTDPLNGMTRFGYDGNGNLLTVTDAKGHTLTHEYDAMDRLSRRIDPLGKAETFSYDGNGNVTSTTDRKNQTTTFTYDPVGQRVRAEYADGSSVSVTHDAVGNLLSATDSLTGTLAYAYDALNRQTLEHSTQGTVLYTYDPAARRQTMQASGLPPVTYGYDANARLTGLAQGAQTAGLGYDAANRRTSLTLPNGITITYVYDEASRLIGQTYAGPTGPLGDLTYTYDLTGNRVGTGGSLARTLIPAAVGTSAYDQANRQLAFGTVSQTFDNNGNLLTQTDGAGTTTYTWDARNRLAAISGPSTSASFAYDALGRRISKTINGVMTTYTFDGLDAIRESGGTGEATYLRTLAIDEALTRTEGDTTLAYLTDILGSTLALADSSGAPITAYTYAPFGETSVAGPPSGSPFQFTGRENDGTGLYYYRARYYDPTRSRFVSEDPLQTTDVNAYAYAQNRPVTARDPLGLWTISVGPRVGFSAFGFAVGGGMSLNIGYSTAEGPSVSITGTAGAYASASVLPMPSLGIQGDVSPGAPSVDSLTGPFVEGGRTIGSPGVGGFVSPDGAAVKGGSLTLSLPLPVRRAPGGASAGGSDTSAIIQVDRNGAHIGRRGEESLVRVRLPDVLGHRKDPPLTFTD
jgi:RHS repeat-associated protein